MSPIVSTSMPIVPNNSTREEEVLTCIKNIGCSQGFGLVGI